MLKEQFTGGFNVSQEDEILNGSDWNEALPDGLKSLHEGLLCLLAFGPDKSPRLVGSGFIIAAHGDYAVGITAAHNFHEGVQRIQEPNLRHSPSALAEFLPQGELISLDRQKIRAIYQIGDRVEVCIIGHAIWDKRTDLAVFTVAVQQPSDGSLFQGFHRLDNVKPAVGDLIFVAGYGDMETTSDQREGNLQQFTLQRRLVLRAGRVKALYPEGHSLCRGPCLETTIPVFGGMSGGPAGLVPEDGRNIIPFGLISSDPDEPVEVKNDRSRAGSSIISLLPLEIANDTGVKRDVLLKLADVAVAQNIELDATSEVAAALKFRPTAAANQDDGTVDR